MYFYSIKRVLRRNALYFRVFVLLSSLKILRIEQNQNIVIILILLSNFDNGTAERLVALSM